MKSTGRPELSPANSCAAELLHRLPLLRLAVHSSSGTAVLSQPAESLKLHMQSTVRLQVTANAKRRQTKRPSCAASSRRPSRLKKAGGSEKRRKKRPGYVIHQDLWKPVIKVLLNSVLCEVG